MHPRLFFITFFVHIPPVPAFAHPALTLFAVFDKLEYKSEVIKMSSAEFLSKANVYEGDYSCILRSPKNEMISRLHYHDFYEFVVYLGNAGVFQIKDGEYLVRRGDIVLIDIFTPHTLVNSKTNYYERSASASTPAC